MKKLIKLTSVLTVFALLALCLAGCAAENGTAEVSLSDFPYGTAEIKELAATIDNYATVPSFNDTEFIKTEGADVFSDKTVFCKGDGVSDDTEAFREGLKQAASANYFLITRPLLITESVLVPDNMTLAFAGGGKLILAEGATLYFGFDCKINAGRQKIFEGSGKVDVNYGGTVRYAYPEWFGAVIGSGADAGPLEALPGTRAGDAYGG